MLCCMLWRNHDSFQFDYCKQIQCVNNYDHEPINQLVEMDVILAWKFDIENLDSVTKEFVSATNDKIDKIVLPGS